MEKTNLTLVLCIAQRKLLQQCELLLATLPSYQCKLYAASTAKELKSLLNSNHIDFILSDLHSYDKCIATLEVANETMGLLPLIILKDSNDEDLSNIQLTLLDSLCISEISINSFELHFKALLNIDWGEVAIPHNEVATEISTDAAPKKEVLELIDEELQPLFKSISLEQKLFALLMIRIDKLQDIKEKYSYDVTQNLQRRVSEVTRYNLRYHDIIIPLGNDTVAVILTNIKSVFDSGYIAQKLVSSLSRALTRASKGHDTTVSIGIASYSNETNTPEKMLKNAGDALSRASKNGGDQCQFFSIEFNKMYKEHVKVEHALTRAISEEEFFLVYQPRYNIKENKIVGLEALIRWQSAKLGFQSPEDFISVAEGTNLIIPIGQWLIDHVCRQYADWKSRNVIAKHIRIGINFSLIQLMNDDIIGYIEKILKDYDLSPDEVEFELTESSFSYDEAFLMKILQEIKKLGVRLFIDDFGTGFASFGQLKRWPLSGLKIDKSFVQDIGKSKINDAIIESILSFTKKTGLQAIAEGVENKEQLDYLTKHGCEEVQGYYFSRPLAVAEIEKLLLKGEK